MNKQATQITLAERTQVVTRLQDRGIYPTPQRIAIAQVLLSKHQHVTADSLQEMLYLSNLRVSKATVYNSLKLFVEKGLINELILDNQKAFYDSNTSHHHHIYNIDTGELSDIETFNLSLLKSINLPNGTKLESVDLVLRTRNS